jgi:hypothetical protein
VNVARCASGIMNSLGISPTEKWLLFTAHCNMRAKPGWQGFLELRL